MVFAGGTLGTVARYLIDLAFDPAGAFALDIFIINIVGATLLAGAVGYITGSGEPSVNQLRFRLFVGTGMMGGFTTYSTLAFHTAEQGVSGDWGGGATYALVTVLVGAVCSAGGLWVGRRARRELKLRKVDAE